MRIKMMASVACATLALAACSQVKPGHVGVKVNQYGSSAGVEATPLNVGTYWVPWGTSIETYPVFTQTHVWSRSKDEGGGDNEEMSFQDKSGVNITADVAVAYHADPSKVPVLYQHFREDMDGIVQNQLRSAVRNAIVENSSTMAVEDIYGPRKAELINAAQAQVTRQFAPFGVTVDQLYWASNIRVPDSIQAQINQRVANENGALAAQAAVATATASANAQREAAKGKADSMALEAAALRENPEMAQLRAIEKWDGKLPDTMVPGAAMPFIGKSAAGQ